MGGDVHRILLQNEPIFTKRKENEKNNEGKQICIFSNLFFWYLAGGILEPLYQYKAYIKHMDWYQTL